MKSLTILLVGLVFLFSCKKESPIQEEETREWGEASATRNENAWNAKCETRISIVCVDKFSLTFTQYNLNNFARNSINFRHLPYHTGTYFPVPFEYGILPDSALTFSFFTLLSDGDVLGDEYRMARDSAVVISIDAIDYNTGIISGQFSGTFVKFIQDGWVRDSMAPDTFIYNDGHFRAHVID